MAAMRALTTLLMGVAMATAPATALRASAQATDPLELVKEGRKLHQAGQYDDALALFQRALAADPKLFDAYLGAGISLDLKGDYAKAREHLLRAIDLAPEPAKGQALTAMGVSYAFEGRAGDAAKYYQQQFDRQMAARALDGAAATANALGRVYLESGDTAKAQEWYTRGYDTAKKLSGLPPDQVDLWELRYQHAMGRIAARRGDEFGAGRHAGAVKAIVDKGGLNAEQSPVYHYLAGYNAFYLKRYDKAIEELTKADQRDPFILGLLAQSYERKGDEAAAREFYAKVLESSAHNIQNAFSRPLARKKLAAR
jgi:tetratricopeptide (TPR) repeat protein